MLSTNLSLLFFFTFLLSFSSQTLSKCHKDDKKALLQIKKEFNNPPSLSSWKPNSDCCLDNWRGIFCDSTNPHLKNRVSSFAVFRDEHLTSQFPPSIGNLRYVEFLFFNILPNLTGPIPSNSISKLSHLKGFTILSTSLSGSLPYFPPKLKNLASICFEYNKFSGSLPPSLSLLPKLQSILLANNNFTGSIPPEYYRFNLDLSNNQLSGSLPKTFSSSELVNLLVADNKLEGDASLLFGSTKTTNVIDISGNNFSFDFGKVIVSNKLAHLHVNHNRIFGKLPQGIENVWNLNVSYNLLCGEIPQRGYLQKFDVSVYFHNKCLCGSPLPKCK